MMKAKKRVLFYLLDGARPDVLSELLKEGHLPNLAQIKAEGGYREATTCFPSTTGPAYLPFLTGQFPGPMNIPGIRWFDKKAFKENRWSTAAVRTYCGPQASLFNTDMPSDRPTLLELMGESYNLYNMITRNVPDDHDLGKKGKSWLYLRAHFLKRHHPVDVQGHERIMQLLNSGKDLDFLFAVFPSVDWDSHYHHVRDHRTIAAYKIADNSLGEVRNLLEKKGWWEDTLFLLTSDHGLTPTHTHLDLASWMTDQGLKSLSHPILWTSNPKSAVMISGNSFGSIHLLNHPGGQPLNQQGLKDHFGAERIQSLLGEKAVDFAIYRGIKEKEYIVENGAGTATVFSDRQQFEYHPLTGDPLGLGDLHCNSPRAALEATFHREYPDAMVQISQLFESKRAGDLIISAKNGYDLRGTWEFPEHKGSHGSLRKEHMVVPMVCNQQGWADHATRTADLFPTLLKWMGKPIPENCGDALI
ncbi:alkaline phosphatase family protein [Pedobacter sp. HMWF019]|uniref:alkaline phosphatase family protein n=1 Tax=Pedobacter sp. HMWF019 TaxID=2056856 RepID=UPI0013048A14|nr:alkaline phosphatase family protein [Pedobacter sp. HMWF019]